MLNCVVFLLKLSGFTYEKDPRLYFDDTCVVPERLEGKTPIYNSVLCHWKLLLSVHILEKRQPQL